MLAVEVQLSVPAGVSLTLTVQLYVPSLFGVQPVVVGFIVVGDTFICGGLHPHETGTALLPCPAKVMVAALGHGVLGTVIDTGAGCCPAVRTPFAGLMAIPLMPLLDDVQFN